MAAWLGPAACPLRFGPIVTAGYDRSLVARNNHARRAQLCPCVLGAAPTSLRVSYVIDSRGEVVAARAEAGAGPVGECLAGVIAQWSLPGGHICGVARVEQTLVIEDG